MLSAAEAISHEADVLALNGFGPVVVAGMGEAPQHPADLLRHFSAAGMLRPRL